MNVFVQFCFHRLCFYPDTSVSPGEHNQLKLYTSVSILQSREGRAASGGCRARVGQLDNGSARSCCLHTEEDE